jgi:hypothetical protein
MAAGVSGRFRHSVSRLDDSMACLRQVLIRLALASAALSPVAAFAADDPSVTACELAVETIITTPATYQRFKATVHGHFVTIDFDAQSPSGAPTRSQAECEFRREGGTWRLAGISVNGDKTVYGGQQDVIGDALNGAGLDQFDGSSLGD